MPPIRLQVGDDLASLIPSGALVWAPGCSAQSSVLAAMAAGSADRLGPATYTGIFVGGLDREVWARGSATSARTYFLTPELKALGERCDFLPLGYGDIAAHLARNPPQCALMMVSPPDAQGRCSFGACVDFIADLWSRIPVRIAHINPSMPRTSGDSGIPFDALTAWVEADQPLAGMPDAAADDIGMRIAGHVADQVPDGATVQTGLGKVPGAVLRALVGHRNLAIHSGLIGDAVVDLARSGALRAERPILAGVAIGSPRLYDAIGEPGFAFHPPSITHDVRRIAAIDRFVAVNSAIEVDLFGQAYAEMGPRGFMSGPGGASDFARGARLSDGGLRIVALPAGAGSESRIVLPPGRGPVSLGRMDSDLIVTEHGAADLRLLGHDDRARALIAIAAPEHREALGARWHAFRKENP